MTADGQTTVELLKGGMLLIYYDRFTYPHSGLCVSPDRHRVHVVDVTLVDTWRYYGESRGEEGHTTRRHETRETRRAAAS